jgi:hypothetical protein
VRNTGTIWNCILNGFVFGENLQCMVKCKCVYVLMNGCLDVEKIDSSVDFIHCIHNVFIIFQPKV